MIRCKACVYWVEPNADNVLDGYENFGVCVLGDSFEGYPSEDTKMFALNAFYVAEEYTRIRTAPDFGCVMGDDGKPKVEIHIDYNKPRCENCGV